jgi:hypothetical protein
VKNEFEQYKPRKINFIETVSIHNSTIKIYTITHQLKFGSNETLKSAINELPIWLTDIENSNLPTHNNAFLIVHEAKEGVLILFNWWTDGEMVETKIYYSNYKSPNKIEASIFDSKALVCIWELEIFYHERKAWIKYVLENSKKPDFKSYSQNYLIQ